MQFWILCNYYTALQKPEFNRIWIFSDQIKQYTAKFCDSNEYNFDDNIGRNLKHEIS